MNTIRYTPTPEAHVAHASLDLDCPTCGNRLPDVRYLHGSRQIGGAVERCPACNGAYRLPSQRLGHVPARGGISMISSLAEAKGRSFTISAEFEPGTCLTHQKLELISRLMAAANGAAQFELGYVFFDLVTDEGEHVAENDGTLTKGCPICHDVAADTDRLDEIS